MKQINQKADPITDKANALGLAEMSNKALAFLNLLPVEELRLIARLRFRTVRDHQALLDDFAESILDEIRDRNRRGEPTRLILPVGPVAQYRKVVEASNRERISWKNVYAVNMDEFLDWQARPLPLTHPFNLEGFMRREVYGRLDPSLRIPEEHQFYPHPLRTDEISEQIRAFGGIDCCYGGIGYHGHLAFNEPPISRWHRITVAELRNSLCRIVTVGDDSIVVLSINASGGSSAAIPPMAVTLGMKDLLASRKMRLYLSGGARHQAVFRISVAGPVTTDFPGTLIQGHPDAEVITDEATASPIQLSWKY